MLELTSEAISGHTLRLTIRKDSRDSNLIVRIAMDGRACKCFRDTILEFFVPTKDEEYFRKWVMENVG